MINYSYKIYIAAESKRQDVTNITGDEITVSTERTGSPGKLEFSLETGLIKDKLDINEGNAVELYVNDYPMFKGYIFTQTRDISGNVKITAYDLLRYFKNKDTYVYTNKKAGDVVKMIAEDFNVLTGIIDDTGYVIGARKEDNQTLIDIILTASELTLVATGKMFVVFDDFGRVCFRNIENMRLPIMLTNDETLTDIDFKTDIDSDTYNQVKLYKDNEKSGKRELFIARDSSNINRWGLLQYYQQAESGMDNVQIDDYAKRFLEVKNRVKKTLKISCLGMGNGEEKIRGGSVIYIKIDELGINNWFVVEGVSHTFSYNQHELSVSVYDF